MKTFGPVVIFAALGAALLLCPLLMPCGRAVLQQGCVNQGQDCRKFAGTVCWLQRRLSWHSDREPHFVTVGNASRDHLGVAWPPYLVLNAKAAHGGWYVFRVGFRYDRNWRGYIFPTVALKRAGGPLRY